MVAHAERGMGEAYMDEPDMPKRNLTPLVSPKLPIELLEVEKAFANLVLVINSNNAVSTERWDRIEAMLKQLPNGEQTDQLQRIEDMLRALVTT